MRRNKKTIFDLNVNETKEFLNAFQSMHCGHCMCSFLDNLPNRFAINIVELSNESPGFWKCLFRLDENNEWESYAKEE